jgi:hypothetical protein
LALALPLAACTPELAEEECVDGRCDGRGNQNPHAYDTCDGAVAWVNEKADLGGARVFVADGDTGEHPAHGIDDPVALPALSDDADAVPDGVAVSIYGATEYLADHDQYVAALVDATQAGADAFRPTLDVTLDGGYARICMTLAHGEYDLERFTEASCLLAAGASPDLERSLEEQDTACCVRRKTNADQTTRGTLELAVASWGDDSTTLEIGVSGAACARQSMTLWNR